MNATRDKAAFIAFLCIGAFLAVAVIATRAGAGALMAFLASYGAMTIGGTKPARRLALATLTACVTFILMVVLTAANEVTR
jgi:hypothetical protein